MDQRNDPNILDDLAAMARADQAGMLGYVAELSTQVGDGWRVSRELALPAPRPKAVAFLGMGGSAIGGDLVKGIWSDRISAPLEVVRGYQLPAWVDRDTLVIASSMSGDTEETLSALTTALQRRCPVVVVSTGGALRNVAQAAGLPLATFPRLGSPRSALGWSLGIVAGILQQAHVLELEAAEIEAGIAAGTAMVARCDPSVPTVDNPAKQLAWSLLDRFVLVTGAGFMAPVARRWKAQLNENSKATATFEELPEATHNTVAGFEQPESLRDHLALVFLSSGLEHPRNGLRASLFGDVAQAAHIWYTVVEASGEGKLGHALSAIVFGDYVSVYLAFMYGVDPSPIDVITHIKEQLTLADQAGTE